MLLVSGFPVLLLSSFADFIFGVFFSAGDAALLSFAAEDGTESLL